MSSAHQNGVCRAGVQSAFFVIDRKYEKHVKFPVACNRGVCYIRARRKKYDAIIAR
jgi:hypothetical protein